MKKLFFVTEARFFKQGGLYFEEGGSSLDLWKLYLKEFDEIVVIARVRKDELCDKDDSICVSMDGVSFLELPYYIGPKGFLIKRSSIRKVLRKKITDDGIYFCRVPGTISGQVIGILKQKGIPYVCHVVGDPDEVFSRSGIDHPLRPLFRIMSIMRMKSAISGSSGNIYVTRETLQKKYPPNEQVLSIGVSDVMIKDELLASSSKRLMLKKRYSLISIGSLEQMYKAPDVAIKAVYSLKNRGILCDLVWLGDGKYKEQLMDLAKSLGVYEQMLFMGNVSPDQVVEHLRSSDIFLMVSRTEGLPRALIEAMAQGLPCVGSRVGGIPELLPDSVLVEKEDVNGLANLIEKFIREPEFSNNQAKNNLEVAKDYVSSVLDDKRLSFFQAIGDKLSKK